MSNFSPEEIEQYEELGFQSEKEARLDYLRHGQPLNQRHKLYLQENERRQRGGGAGVPLRPNHQTNASRETYQQPYYQTNNQDREAGPSTYQVPTAAYQRPYTTWSSQAYSAASPEEQNITIDGAGSIYTPSSVDPQDTGYYSSPIIKPIQSQPNGQTAVMRTMMQRGDNKRNIQVCSANGSWQGLKAILDDGTEENWISKKASDRLNLRIKEGLRKDYTTFDGKRISSVASTEVSWCVEGSSTSETTVFRIAEGRAPFDVLFGRDLISSGEIDFWGESNPIQVLTETDVKEGERHRIVQNQSSVQSETERLAEQRRQRNANKSRQDGQNSEKSSRDTRKDNKRPGYGERRRS